MGSGRGDRNQLEDVPQIRGYIELQWGPVVVTGIRRLVPLRRARRHPASMGSGRGDRNQQGVADRGIESLRLLQWGPVVVTGISCARNRAVDLMFARQLQWGPVVVTGIRYTQECRAAIVTGFNGVRSW